MRLPAPLSALSFALRSAAAASICLCAVAAAGCSDVESGTVELDESPEAVAAREAENEENDRMANEAMQND
ncbi:hypothetical protein [Alienimonas chondri]|uniref:Secreted protein n=1 Tax=Alienimonas chondri TaxID=2681879 RepID=A0ABX1VAU3_9PLAN|nr:hypothetical protein [Alienimonas chondri]NNJ25209.1 hypothetical protein [Alienimonas chondri]